MEVKVDTAPLSNQSTSELTAGAAIPATPKKTLAHWPLLVVLASIQFAHVLDFIIVMPLGPKLMRTFDIGTSFFGMLTAAYNLSAALAGFLGALYLDRFDRRKALLFIFAGFILATASCSVATNEWTLLAGRMTAGVFGGFIQALLFAIIGDTFSEEKRGAATGTVVSAFSIASIAGVPLSLWLSEHFDWRAPFVLLTALSVFSWLAAARLLPVMDQHLTSKPTRTALRSLWNLALEKRTLVACGLIIALMFAGFSVIPFMSTYLVTNVGLSEADLATVFLAGGIATLLTSRLTGMIADRFGKERVFQVLALLSTVPVFVLTRLEHVSAFIAVGVATAFTVLTSARAIPALAMIVSCVDRQRRGSFLSLTSSVQQAASGLASLCAGALLAIAPSGEMLRYDLAGDFAIFAILIAVYAAYRLKRLAR